MSEFGIVENTMFIPMLGRIYASEMHPEILYDKKALSYSWGAVWRQRMTEMIMRKPVGMQ